ncbi:MAG: MOSC domain-containing protein [Acidobacteria bacterium]|nr:MOSC domain-containing protein [Acidobacteriota bacterium]MCB9377584.1 MOSC domain-containing protein [Holophagales bacterium]
MVDSHSGRQVGRVVALFRYPVKSMAGESLAEVEASWHGFAGDRRWAFVRPGVVESGFPWLTLRERAEMGHYHPSFAEPARPDASPTVVRTPAGDLLGVTDPALAAELGPDGTRVIRQSRGIFDTFPLSLVTTQTIQRLGELVGRRLEVERFRPNLLVEAAGDEPFAEDGWVGSVLRVGGLRLRVDKRDGRCAVITVDPASTERDPAILRTVVEERQGCLGVYGSTVEPGRVALGDPVVVEAGPRAPA